MGLQGKVFAKWMAKKAPRQGRQKCLINGKEERQKQGRDERVFLILQKTET